MRIRRRLISLLVGTLLVAVPGAAADEREVIGRSVEGRAIVAAHDGAAGGGAGALGAEGGAGALGAAGGGAGALGAEGGGAEGGGAVRILVFGSIHGNETAGMPISRRLIAAAAPPGVALTVVPTINPDGVARGSRGNARGVDLNRNFPVAWRPLGGLEHAGPRPLSEPESRAAERLVRRLRPAVTIWFHQPFGLVDRPEGDPLLARRYADLAGLPLVRLRRYPGSATRWQNRALPRSTAFVVELPAFPSRALIDRAGTAVGALARELASPGLGERGAARVAG